MATEGTHESAEGLLLEAKNYLSAFPPDIDAAQQILEKAVKHYPNEPDILSAYGELQSEAGDTDLACSLFEKCIQLEPNKNPERYFYLGQLQVGYTALATFQKGIELLKGEMDSIDGVSLDLANKLCSAYCAITELYMTDLCDEENAEEECVKHIELALKVKDDSIEAHHCKAQYHKIVGELEAAVGEIRVCLQLLKSAKIDSVPSIELRINICRTLVDLNETESAIEVCEDCLEEDDQDVQVWYVLACAHLVSNTLQEALDCAYIAERILKSTVLWKDEACNLNAEIPALIEEIHRRQKGMKAVAA